MTPEELEAVNRLREWLGPGWDDVPDQKLLDTLAGQRTLLRVHLEELGRSIAVQLGELAHRLLSWRGPWRW